MEIFKSILLKQLRQHGWDIHSAELNGIDWWADEHWTIQSTRANWGMTLIISFLVDPLWDGPRKKGQGVWAIGVTRSMPCDRLEAEDSISDLLCVKGPFAEQVIEFVSSINEYRHNA